MAQYLAHPPIVLAFEHECVNLLCCGHTYQLEAAQGRRLERLLRTGRITDETRLQYDDLIAFMLTECLASLQDRPSESVLTVKDHRAVGNAHGWLALRRLSFAFVLVVGVVDLFVLPASYDGFVDVLLHQTELVPLLLIPLLLHEAVHYFTGRVFGLDGKPGMALHGWLFPVATITFSNLYELPKHLRWLPVLAPMVLDGAIFLSLLPFRESAPIAFFHFFYGVGILWQFLIFLRTDIYLFVATTFNQPNLNRLIWGRDRISSAGALAVAETKAKLLYWAFFAFSLIAAARFVSTSL